MREPPGYPSPWRVRIPNRSLETHTVCPRLIYTENENRHSIKSHFSMKRGRPITKATLSTTLTRDLLDRIDVCSLYSSMLLESVCDGSELDAGAICQLVNSIKANLSSCRTIAQCQMQHQSTASETEGSQTSHFDKQPRKHRYIRFGLR